MKSIFIYDYELSDRRCTALIASKKGAPVYIGFGGFVIFPYKYEYTYSHRPEIRAYELKWKKRSVAQRVKNWLWLRWHGLDAGRVVSTILEINGTHV